MNNPNQHLQTLDLTVVSSTTKLSEITKSFNETYAVYE
jgi:hypothetical protein